ncbi:MAG: TlpA disulfide reductase family protein [Candidatus Kapaibacterium sp.]
MRIRFSVLTMLVLSAMLTSGVSAQNLSKLTNLLSTQSGEQTSVAKLGQGKVTVLSFWATWCKPCKEEMQATYPIMKKLGDSAVYIAVSVDNTKTIARVAPYITSKGYTFPVLLDPNKDLLSELNGTDMPYTLVSDAEGALRFKHMGFFQGDEVKLEKEVRELLAEVGHPSTQH